MNNGFKVIFNFSFLRIIKNKILVILTGIVFLLIALIAILTLNVGANLIFKAEICMLFIITLGIFWLSFVNITFVVNSLIIDNNNGLQSLQNRRGLKNSQIFWAKLLPLKIITISFVLIAFILTTLITAASPITSKGFLISNIFVGIFSLIAYDFLIFGMVVFLSGMTNSLKKTLPFVWVITTVFMFFAILGPMPFALDSGAGISNEFNMHNKIKWEFKKNTAKDNKGLLELEASAKKLRQAFDDNIIQDNDNGIIRDFKDYQIVNAAFNKGMILEFGKLIEEGKFTETIDWYFHKFLSSLEKVEMEINEANLKKELSENLYYQFVKSQAQKASHNQAKDFKKSYFHISSKTNYNTEKQLNSILKNFKNDSNLNVSLSETEKMALIKAIEDFCAYEINPFSNESTIYVSKPGLGHIFANYQIWIDQAVYSPGTYLFNMLAYSLINYYDNEININMEEFKWKAPLEMNYKVNPFMWFYEMVYFSGTENIANDNLIAQNSPLPISLFNLVKFDDQGEMIFSKRPFAVWANYLGFIGLGTLLTGLGYSSFTKKRDRRKQLD